MKIAGLAMLFLSDCGLVATAALDWLLPQGGILPLGEGLHARKDTEIYYDEFGAVCGNCPRGQIACGGNIWDYNEGEHQDMYSFTIMHDCDWQEDGHDRYDPDDEEK